MPCRGEDDPTKTEQAMNFFSGARFETPRRHQQDATEHDTTLGQPAWRHLEKNFSGARISSSAVIEFLQTNATKVR
jgi:hypothetical protein